MCTNHRNPLHCILPPYMSDKLDELLGGDPEKPTDERFRNKRKELAALPSATRSFDMTGKPVNKKLIREVYDAHESPMDIGELIW